jgi:hypothetical protein
MAEQLSGFAELHSLKTAMLKYAEGNILLEELLRGATADILASVTTHADALKRLVASESAETRELVGAEHVKTRQHAAALQQSLQSSQKAETEARQLIQSLWYETINARRTQIDQAYPETFEWLFTPRYGANSFADWLRSDKAIFWVNGKPGSGKSTLMNFLLTNSQTKEHLGDSAIYSFFLWRSGVQMQRTRRGMFCSLLHQMLVENEGFAQHLIRDYPSLVLKRTPLDWGLPELESTLQHVLGLHDRLVCFFVDGLDEMDSGEDTFDLKEMTARMFAGTHRIKLCVSSRSEPVWSHMLQNYPSIKLQDLTRDDLRTVARDLLTKYFEDLVRKESQDNLKELIDLLVWKSSGVFLWLHLVLKSLYRGLLGNENFGELQQRIERIPTSLNDVYRDMWARLGEDAAAFKKTAAKYFRFLILRQDMEVYSSTGLIHFTLGWNESNQEGFRQGGVTFLKSRAFMEACKDTQRSIETRCAGLVEFSPDYVYSGFLEALTGNNDLSDPRTQNSDFVHRTAKDWLLGTDDGHQLIKDCPVDSAQMAVLQSLFFDAEFEKDSLRASTVFRSLGTSFSDDTGFNYWEWSLGRNWGLSKLLTCCATLERSDSTLWHAVSAEVINRTKLLFDDNDLTNFYEEAADSGLLEPIRALVDSRDDKASPGNISLLYYLATFSRSERTRNHLAAWAMEWGEGLPWRQLFTGHLTGQCIPVLQDIVMPAHDDGSDFDAVKSFYRQNRHSPRKFLSISTLFRSRCYRQCMPGFPNDPGIHVANLSFAPKAGSRFEDLEKRRQVDIIAEVNLAQMFNDVLASSPVEAPSSQKQTELREMIFRPEECYRQVLVVGSYSHQGNDAVSAGMTLGARQLWRIAPGRGRKAEGDITAKYLDNDYDNDRPNSQISADTETSLVDFFALSNARYAIPTKEQAGAISTALDGIGWSGETQKELTDQTAALEAYVEDILATGENRITDIAETLRQNGHFIVSSEQIQRLVDCRTLEDRVLVMEELNQLASEMENQYGEACRRA